MKTHILVLTAALAFAAPVLAQEHSGHSGHANTTGDPAYAAQMAAHETMTRDMGGIKPSGRPDVDFVSMMIPHHQGAIDMAEVELKYGTDPALKELARTIIEAQKREIAEMKKWLTDNGQ